MAHGTSGIGGPVPFLLRYAPWAAALAATAWADTLSLPAARARAAADPGAGTQVIPFEDLARRQNLAEALKAVPGFRVRVQSGLGGYAEAWFRGADARQIAVYLDGMPLNSSLDPAVDLGRLPPLMVREMAVERAGSAEGPGAGVAAIRLSSLPRGIAPVSVTGRLSSFGGQEAALAAKAGSGDAAAYLGAGVQAARNDHPFPTDNGTAFAGGDDHTRAMRNNAYAGHWVSLAWRDEGLGGSLRTAGVRWDAHRKEYPGIYTDLSRAYTERSDLAFHALWRDSLEGARLQGFSAGADARATVDAFRDPGKSLGFRTFSLDREGRLLSGNASLTARLPAGASLRLGSRAGFEASDSREATGFREYTPPDARRWHADPFLALALPLRAGFSARSEAVFAWERLESEDMVGIGGRKTAAPFERDALAETWRLLIAWRGKGPMGALLEVEAAERLPALHELLGDNNGVHRNLGLLPQSARGASLEVTLAAGAWRLAAGPAYQVSRGPIRLAPLGASNFLHFVNGSDYRSLAWETRIDGSGPRWRAGSALNAARPAILRGPTAGRLPAYASSLETYSDFSFSPLPSLWLDADFELRSAYYPDDRNLPGTRRPPEAVAGAGLRWRKRRVEAALRGDNLGDAHYQDFAYSPKSGRRWSFRLSMNP